MSRSAPVLAHAAHRPANRARAERATPSPSTSNGPKASSTSTRSNRPAPWAGRADSHGHPVRRTAGEPRNVHLGQPDRHGRGGRGIRRTVRLPRQGLPDRARMKARLSACRSSCRPWRARSSCPNVIARARIDVKSDTAQVIATTAKVPTIVGGIPIRMRSITLSINRQGFERNPTNCGVLATESTVGGFTPGGATASAALSTPFQAEGCSALAFKPSFSASTGGKPTQTRTAPASKRRSTSRRVRPTSNRCSSRCPSSCPRA